MSDKGGLAAADLAARVGSRAVDGRQKPSKLKSTPRAFSSREYVRVKLKTQF